MHRRLSITAFDLVEIAMNLMDHDISGEADHNTEKSSHLSRSETGVTTGYGDESIVGSRSKSLRTGWSERSKLCLEV